MRALLWFIRSGRRLITGQPKGLVGVSDFSVTFQNKCMMCENTAVHAGANPMVATTFRLARRWDSHGVGAAGADGAAGDGVEGFIEADFYGSEEVVTAADCHAF
jgi:hypothetical protein